MMASLEFKICGSGTRSTRTSPFPYQQTACIEILPLVPRTALKLRQASLRRQGLPEASGGLAHGGGDFTRLHELLESSQCFLKLSLRVVTNQLCNLGA